MGTNEVVLVNEKDEVLGTMEKLRAHEEGVLHRAFSVIIFNSKGEMLIHQRAIDKYHCGGLWTNACCSHPRLNESPKEGAERRLNEEMGFSVPVEYIGSFIYKIDFENGLTEHEFDHMFCGRFDGTPEHNQAEVEKWKYVSVEKLLKDLEEQPESYTFWFRDILKNRIQELIRYDQGRKKNNI
jgi:isopentenyl-diphosphate delta-isomerase